MIFLKNDENKLEERNLEEISREKFILTYSFRSRNHNCGTAGQRKQQDEEAGGSHKGKTKRGPEVKQGYELSKMAPTIVLLPERFYLPKVL